MKWTFYLVLIISIGSIIQISVQGQAIESNPSTKKRNVIHPNMERYQFPLQDFAVDPQKLKNKPVAIYFVPHADDEVLTYGVPIRNDIQAGKEVFAVLVSHGDSTGAIVPINKKLKKKLTPRQIGQARITEFRSATTHLGIDDSHKVVYDLLITPKTRDKDRNQLTQIITHYAQQFPHAEFKGMSVKDQSPDHTLIGEVLADLKRKRIISKVQVYASVNLVHLCQSNIRCQNKLKKLGKPEVIGKVSLAKKEDKANINKAINAYYVWDPKNNRYAIGKHSVPHQFTLLKKNYETTIVKE